jgi:hypothetical protein
MKTKLFVSNVIIIVFLFLQFSSLKAQTEPLPAITLSANADLMSRYIWRGLNPGQVPSIQPGLSASWKNFTLGTWGAYKLAGPGYQETDFYISKKLGAVTLAIWDYFSFYDTASAEYFNYRKNTTLHVLEAQVLIKGGEKIPFNLLASYFFYGADPSKSIYLELQYLFSAGPVDMTLFAGYQPKGTYYASKADFVNIGCTAIKKIKITDNFSLPLNLSLIVNPNINSVYIVAGLSF